MEETMWESGGPAETGLSSILYKHQQTEMVLSIRHKT
jgi:hypothetical protein